MEPQGKVTHDPPDSLRLSDHLVFIEAGRLVQDGTRRRSSPSHAIPMSQVVGLDFLRGRRIDDLQVRSRDHGRGPRGPPGAGVCVTIPPSPSTGCACMGRRATPGWSLNDILLIGQTARVSLADPFVLVAEVTTEAAAELRLGVGQELWATARATEVRVYPA